jgi:serine-type D-Ala-D-Ala carboxypeptidase
MASIPDVDKAIQKGISDKVLPGAVLHIGNTEKVIERVAYGKRDLSTLNDLSTIYDLASLTKVIATATSIMILEEQGKLNVSDRLSLYYPEYAKGQKKDLLIEDLLRHRSGLASGIRLLQNETYDSYIGRIVSSPLSYTPRLKTVYSDPGFILLGDIVQKVSGESLQDFVRDNIFHPLKMFKTGYFVEEANKVSCAPTLIDRLCVPHDPVAYAMYPLNLGHAGLFSTGDDVARFAMMYLNKGELEGTRILSQKSVERMTVLSSGEIRGLGWDLLSPYATAPRGELFAKGISYGHTGYTGTSIWIDPKSGSFYVFLANRVLLGDQQTSAPFKDLRHAVSTGVAKLFYSSFSSEETAQ